MAEKKFTDAEYLAAYEQSNGSARGAAKLLGVSHTLINKIVKRHNARKNQDPAVKEAMESIGSNLIPSMVWFKTDKNGNKSYSILAKPDSDEQQSFLERIQEAFENLPEAAKLPLPKELPLEDLLTVYPIADAHIGMRAWGEEVGEDWDSDIACQVIRQAMGECVAGSPPSHTGIILNVGDMFHANDDNNSTPKSKHVLDVDSRHFRTIDRVIALTVDIIELALQKHQKVIYRALRGNHDEHTHMALTFALFERYRSEERVTIEKNPSDYFVYQFGKVMICSHHGDKAAPTKIVLFMADEWPEIWGATKHRVLFTGHKHHEHTEDIGGVNWIGLRAATKRDTYSHSHSYVGKSQLRSLTYHSEYGQRSSVVVNY
jgi:hypothetical protein